ncbi:MAG: hypothetical protein K2Y25_09220 [Pseudomonadaceae bacterium]|nr:hypothetical protein [Pseudomonadaceae bacterium]
MTFYLYMAAMTYGVIIGVDIGGGRPAQALPAAIWAVLWPICWAWVALKIYKRRRLV